MKLNGQVRAVERSLGNKSFDNPVKIEKRNFKIDVKPASKPDTYYGYGSMNFILHGRELEECGLDLGTKVEIYLVREDQDGKPPVAELDDAKREIYEMQQKIEMLESTAARERERYAGIERHRTAAGERLQALQQENIRLTTELLTLRQTDRPSFSNQTLLSDTNQR